ncbi:hypothetical protein E4U28_001472, partial [Claviceps purpurea]
MTLREVGDRLLDVGAMVAIGAHMVTTVICLAGLELQAVEDKRTDEVAEQLSVGFYGNMRKGSSARSASDGKLPRRGSSDARCRCADSRVPTPEDSRRSGQGPHALRPGGAAVHFSVTKPK